MRADLLRLFEHDFPSLRASVLRLENGSPVGFPVQFRVNGNDISKIRAIAHQIADAMRSNANINQYAIELERAKYYHAH